MNIVGRFFLGGGGGGGGWGKVGHLFEVVEVA